MPPTEDEAPPRRYAGRLSADALQDLIDQVRRAVAPFAIVESLVAITYPDADTPIVVGESERGRVFTELTELSWEAVADDFDVVWLSQDADETPEGLAAVSLPPVSRQDVRLDLWPAGNARLPDRPDYGLGAGQPVACVCQYHDAEGRLVAYRYVRLETR